MERNEVKDILTVLKTNYPSSFKGWANEQSYNFLDLWNEAFKDDDVNVVILAVKKIIYTDTREFYPNIATVKKVMYNLTSNDIDEYEAFAQVLSNIDDAQVRPDEVFERLPIKTQRAIGNAETLNSWAWTDAKTLDSFIANSFYQAYRKISKDDYEQAVLPNDFKNQVNLLSNNQNNQHVLFNQECENITHNKNT